MNITKFIVAFTLFLILPGCTAFNTPPPVAEPVHYPVVTSTYVVMDPGKQTMVVLKTTSGFIQLGAGDVFTCKEKKTYTICQVFGEPL